MSVSLKGRSYRRFLATACTVAALLPGAALAAEKSVTIGLTADPSHLYPLAGEELSSNIMYYHLYDPLVKRNADLSFGPGLAEKLGGPGRHHLAL